MGNRSKIRLYDFAKELKIDTNRLIEEVRREGVNVSVPSNAISKDLAERIRHRYFPKKAAKAKRAAKDARKAKGPQIVGKSARKTFTVRRQQPPPPSQRCKVRRCPNILLETDKKKYEGFCVYCYRERHQGAAAKMVPGGLIGLGKKFTVRIGKAKVTSNEVARRH